MKSANKNSLIALSLSALGTIYLIYYIFRASLDVVASDYIRIINYYLDDVSDLKYLFSWECISRIPFTFLARYINVNVFKYSVNFDRILGIAGLFLFNFEVVSYILNTLKSDKLKAIFSVLLTYISFSLISWEMVLNGTGYAHFITIGLIALTFKTKEPVKYILIVVTSLLFSGSYGVSFLLTLIFFSLIQLLMIIIEKKKMNKVKYEPIITIIISLICLYCFMKSNNTGEPLIPVGIQDISLMELIKMDPTFPIRFILKSLASSIIGVETFDYAINFKTASEKIIFVVGLIYLLIIIWAIIIQLRRIIKEKNDKVIFTLENKFLIYGLANYLLIFLARYAFVRDEYGMSSRYGLQYMFLTIAVIIIIAKYIDTEMFAAHTVRSNVGAYAAHMVRSNVGASEIVGADTIRHNVGASEIVRADTIRHNVGASYASPSTAISKYLPIVISTASIFFILLGHVTTNTDEIFKADYRKIAYINLKEKAMHYEDIENEELENLFEYRRNPEHIRSALNTLKDQQLNIFK